MKVEVKVEELIEPIVNNLGFEIEYVEFVKEGSNNVLRVVIDRTGEKMWVDDCEKVSRAIEDVVDKNINQEYVLEVSSPGLERQLKNGLYPRVTLDRFTQNRASCMRTVCRDEVSNEQRRTNLFHYYWHVPFKLIYINGGIGSHSGASFISNLS